MPMTGAMPKRLFPMTVIRRHCYNCAHYICKQEPFLVRDKKGKRKAEKRWIERCAKKDNAKLKVATVEHGLVERQEWYDMGQPRTYGSEADYVDENGNIVRCTMHEFSEAIMENIGRFTIAESQTEEELPQWLKEMYK